MYFSFCKPSILKWQYGIHAFSCFKFIAGLWSQSFFFTRNMLLTNSHFDGWLPSLTFFLPPVPTIRLLLDSLLVGKGFLTEKVLNEMELCILLLCPKFWDPVLLWYKLLQTISVFLPMERMEYFLTRIIFLPMGESFLIPTKLVFLDLNRCWRRFAFD